MMHTLRPFTLNKDDVPLKLKLFVYGTLKKGYPNHQYFCSQAEHIETAVVWGRLYDLRAGYPALEIPEASILAHGTRNPDGDVSVQWQNHTLSFEQPSGDWSLVHGEVITFAEPHNVLPAIDRLEGFRPNQSSLYQRNLVVVRAEEAVYPAWIYSMLRVSQGTRLLSGHWEGGLL